MYPILKNTALGVIAGLDQTHALPRWRNLSERLLEAREIGLRKEGCPCVRLNQLRDRVDAITLDDGKDLLGHGKNTPLLLMGETIIEDPCFIRPRNILLSNDRHIDN